MDENHTPEAGGDRGEAAKTATAGDGIVASDSRPKPTVTVLPGASSVSRLGDYDLLEQLGEGAMGVVFKARQLSLNRLVALKVMNFNALAAGAAGGKRFRLEAEALARLDHPNIVSIYELREDQGRYYFSMRLIEGRNLAREREQFVKDLKAAASLIASVARAVHHAHQQGIVHRDLKPSNILIDQEAKPHVTDFGLAKFVECNTDLTQPGMILGTPDYMSPEQAKGGSKHVERFSDVFSLGIMLYELITGRLPFKGPTSHETLRRILETEPDRPSAVNPAVDAQLEGICLQCLKKEPSKRYETAEALANDLERWSKRSGPFGGASLPHVKRTRCRLDCRELAAECLHLRPASFLVHLCQSFPNTEFRILRDKTTSEEFPEPIDPKSITELVSGYFEHGEVITLEVSGQFEVMASEFFKVAWEHLGGYSDDVKASKARLTTLIDDIYSRIYDPDLDEVEDHIIPILPREHRKAQEDYRCMAIINDRLHNLSLPMIPLIAKHFDCRVQIFFEVPEKGIFSFTMEPANNYELDDSILELDIGVGTRITVLAFGANREAAAGAVHSILESLWQCDQWLRQKNRDFESKDTILELLEFAREMSKSKSTVYGYVKNPFISNLLTSKHVYVNPPGTSFSKEEVLNQLSAPHARMHRLDVSAILERVRESEKRQPVVLRPGFAIAHGAMDRSPRISISFGVYPQGVQWSDDEEEAVTLVAMVICARDTYRTWRDYMKRFAILFRSNPALQAQLVAARGSEDFVALLRSAETGLMNA